MASDPALERRVTRLENDTHSIYELIADMRTTLRHQTRRFENIEARLTSTEGTLTSHSRILESHSQTLAAHTQRFDKIDGTLAEILRRLPSRS